MKDRAEKKIQIAIDKLIDLKDDFIDDPGDIERCLDQLRGLESKIMNGYVKNNRLII